MEYDAGFTRTCESRCYAVVLIRFLSVTEIFNKDMLVFVMKHAKSLSHFPVRCNAFVQK